MEMQTLAQIVQIRAELSPLKTAVIFMASKLSADDRAGLLAMVEAQLQVWRTAGVAGNPMVNAMAEATVEFSNAIRAMSGLPPLVP